MKKIIILISGIFLVIGFVFATDSDGDIIEDSVDNCYNYYNPDQQDSNDDELGDACDVVEHTVYLNEGWNLVSFPLNFGLITAKSLNETLDGALHSIFFYYRNDTYDGWHYFVADYSTNTLNVFDPSYGFWMKVKGQVNLTLRAPRIYTATQEIYSGWNLIGYPWQTMLLTDAFGGELDYLDVMFVLDSFTPEWLSWGYGKPVVLNTYTQAVPGYGIWLKANQDRNWTIENGTII